MSTWGTEETGIVVVVGTGKNARVRPAKPARPPKVAKPAKQAAAKQAAAKQAEPARYAPPMIRPTATARPSAIAPAQYPRSSSVRAVATPPQGGGIRMVLGFVLAIATATGGFAVGALTELGTEVEVYVLGPIPIPKPPTDPRVPVLEIEITRLQDALAAEQRATAEPRATAAARAQAAVAAKPEPRHSRRSRRHRDR